MDRSGYKIFSPGAIAGLTLSNRLVRSGTWDPSIHNSRQMSEAVLELYRQVALGGVGLIISGGFPVYRERFPEEDPGLPPCLYADVRINGLKRLSETVHQARPDCKIVAQLEPGYMESGPSPVVTAFSKTPVRPMTAAEIETLVGCFVTAIVDMQTAGFDGVQLHAAHGGLLSRFFSPLYNRREDAYGGTVEKRVHILRQIVAQARQQVGDFPILIKINGTDDMECGVDIHNFPALVDAVVRAGVDAVEISGSTWDCLFRPEEELGFRPVPAPESHTRIQNPEKQSYYLSYAEQVRLPVPVILVGGNRDIERMEAILQAGRVDFMALCRPLIREPGLPARWEAGLGSKMPECTSCNSCIYALIVHPGQPEPGLVSCICKTDKKLHARAQRWIAGWVKKERQAQ